MWLQAVAESRNNTVYSPDSVRKHASQILLSGPASPARPGLQRYIHQRYAETYQADVSHFLPLLLSSQSDTDIFGVLGLRPASAGALFIEQYLLRPVEAAIADVTGRQVARNTVIEVGNLASEKGGSQQLFIVLTELLYQAGFNWVCFTATPHVTALLKRLGFAPEVLARADPACTADGGRSWGTYYDHHPSVLVGDVVNARHTLFRNDVAARLMQERSADIQSAKAALATFLKSCAQQEGACCG